MTNAELITKIKTEIERRLKNTRDYMNGAGMKYKGPKYHASRGRESAYDAILSFLSTLEKSEKPMNLEDLEEEINRLWESFADEMEGPHNLFDIYARLARHFAEWGAEHLKK